MSVIDIQKAAVLESTRQAAAAGELYHVYTGELYHDTIAALEAKNVVVVPNVCAADSTKQFVFYEIKNLLEP
jgi:hypothetical protein